MKKYQCRTHGEITEPCGCYGMITISSLSPEEIAAMYGPAVKSERKKKQIMVSDNKRPEPIPVQGVKRGKDIKIKPQRSPRVKGDKCRLCDNDRMPKRSLCTKCHNRNRVIKKVLCACGKEMFPESKKCGDCRNKEQVERAKNLHKFRNPDKRKYWFSDCKIEGCKDGKPGKIIKGFCAKHYKRFLKHGDAGMVFKLGRPKKQEISYCFCGGVVSSRGLCIKHYRRFMDHGNEHYYRKQIPKVGWRLIDDRTGEIVQHENV